MSEPRILIDDEEEERRLLQAAIDEARADPRRIPHERMREWLLRLAAGEFDAPVPEPDRV